MSDIIQWMIQDRIAYNTIQAQNIYAGLKLSTLSYDAQVERVLLYRKWRPKTDRKNQVPTKQAFDLAIAGIDPDDVQVRQMDVLKVLTANAGTFFEDDIISHKDGLKDVAQHTVSNLSGG